MSAASPIAQSHEAFAELMRLHNRLLYRAARSILRDDAEAEDAVQEAYLRAYGSVESFRGEAKLSTWLVRIVVNEALARARKSGRRAEIAPIVTDEGDLGVPDEKHEGPESRAERGEIRRLLEAKIDALPDAYRSVFVLRALEELSVDETAEALGIPAATVRTRFFRARSLLREALSPELASIWDEAFAFAGQRCARIVAAVMAALAARACSES